MTFSRMKGLWPGPCLLSLCLLIGPGGGIRAVVDESFEIRLAEDIADFELDDFSHPEAAFILSGVQDPDTLARCMAWYGLVLDGAKAVIDYSDRVGSANRVFHFLHARWLRHYRLEATTLLDIMHGKTYNCVSATILYNLLCTDIGWSTDAFETPTHVYTLFNNFTRDIMVENTSPIGFNIVQNLRAYSQMLAQYYPDNQAYRIGLSNLYLFEQKGGRRIDNTELLGLLAYNQAYFARKDGRFERAYRWVALAQNFNRDSRSNQKFELNLYREWTLKLYESSRYAEAFQILADAAYRYPGEPDFTKNLRASFLSAMKSFWEAKDWQAGRDLVFRYLDSDAVKSGPDAILAGIFRNWAAFLASRGLAAEAGEAGKIAERFESPGE
ncbi:hypothetical protein JW906_07050 [bacterium]|nr:hypothetical protein [bacterium]